MHAPLNLQHKKETEHIPTVHQSRKHVPPRPLPPEQPARSQNMNNPSDHFLDARGLSCPLPVLKANRILRDLAPGERLRIIATDRTSIADFQSFCRETGHALVAFSENSGELSFVIRRKPAPVHT